MSDPSYGLFQTGPNPVPYEPRLADIALHVQRMTEAFKGVRFGWSPTMGEDVGYVGERCGWYPAKPKRRRKVTTHLR